MSTLQHEPRIDYADFCLLPEQERASLLRKWIAEEQAELAPLLASPDHADAVQAVWDAHYYDALYAELFLISSEVRWEKQEAAQQRRAAMLAAKEEAR